MYITKPSLEVICKAGQPFFLIPIAISVDIVSRFYQGNQLQNDRLGELDPVQYVVTQQNDDQNSSHYNRNLIENPSLQKKYYDPQLDGNSPFLGLTVVHERQFNFFVAPFIPNKRGAKSGFVFPPMRMPLEKTAASTLGEPLLGLISAHISQNMKQNQIYDLVMSVGRKTVSNKENKMYPVYADLKAVSTLEANDKTGALRAECQLYYNQLFEFIKTRKGIDLVEDEPRKQPSRLPVQPPQQPQTHYQPQPQNPQPGAQPPVQPTFNSQPMMPSEAVHPSGVAAGGSLPPAVPQGIPQNLPPAQPSMPDISNAQGQPVQMPGNPQQSGQKMSIKQAEQAAFNIAQTAPPMTAVEQSIDYGEPNPNKQVEVLNAPPAGHQGDISTLNDVLTQMS